jgi:Rps23 Pro-64 3,4-dihydroxylase Tpa1-like proline 4-hydroxylase
MTRGLDLRARLSRKAIDELRARSPSEPDALWRLASLCRQAGELSSAQEALERIPPAQRTPAARRMLAILAREPLPGPAHASGCQPAPFALRDGFLDERHSEELGRLVQDRRNEFAPGKVYTPDHQKQPVVAETARTSLVLSSPDDVAEWLLPRVRDEVEAALPVLGLPQFGLFDTEIHISGSGNADRLRCHQDVRPHPAPQRRVSYVYYFHVGRRAFQGGDFLLYDTDVAEDRWNPAAYTRIEPLHNRLLLFGGHTYHEVTEVQCDPERWESRRFAVCGWFRESVTDPA